MTLGFISQPPASSGAPSAASWSNLPDSASDGDIYVVTDLGLAVRFEDTGDGWWVPHHWPALTEALDSGSDPISIRDADTWASLSAAAWSATGTTPTKTADNPLSLTGSGSTYISATPDFTGVDGLAVAFKASATTGSPQVQVRRSSNGIGAQIGSNLQMAFGGTTWGVAGLWAADDTVFILFRIGASGEYSTLSSSKLQTITIWDTKNKVHDLIRSSHAASGLTDNFTVTANGGTLSLDRLQVWKF